MLKRFVVVIFLISLGVAVSLGLYAVHIHQPAPDQAALEAAAQQRSKKPPQAPRTATITLTAAGDCLMHNTQIWSGLQADGSYSFPTFFPEVKELIEQGDYSSTCLEAPLAGSAGGYTGYPRFNSPDAVVHDFKEAGFDLIVTAHNHTMDRGYQGALRTLDVLQQSGLDTVGTYRNEEERSRFVVKDIRGVKVGYLAYSYSTNGIPVPRACPWFFNFLDRETILSDISALRPQVDVLLVVLHWGVEYNPAPTQEQRFLAREILEAGADAILGSHPHVIQPMEVINIDGQDKFVIYSMGNFISHQIGLERNSGIVLKLRFTRDFTNGNTILEEASYTPTYSHSYYHNGHRYFRVVPVERTMEKIKSGQEPFLGQGDLPVLEQVLRQTRQRLGSSFYRCE